MPHRNLHFWRPLASALILTHILQTEMKSKVNAFKERLQREPAFPNGSPSRRTIMGTSQIATQACDFYPEVADGHSGRRLSRARGHPRPHHSPNPLPTRAPGSGPPAPPDPHQPSAHPHHPPHNP